jgi:hypothetical protein
VWLRQLGFPLSVLAGLAASAYLASSVRVPDSVPDYALQAAPVYRLEVGVACFGVFYLAAIAFLLALEGRGFVELGARGMKAGRVIQAADDEQDVTLAKQMKLLGDMKEDVTTVKSALREAVLDLKVQERRLDRLEEQKDG